MIPGLSSGGEARLAAFLEPSITDFRFDSLATCDFHLFDAGEPEARQLGIEFTGGHEPTIVLTDPTRRIGHIRVQALGRNNTIFFDNRRWGGNCLASIRMLGSDCALIFNDIGDSYVNIQGMLMRSEGQLLFWGIGATAVGLSMEIEGIGRSFVIGDDALISNGVWIRNYDMHALHDLRSGAQISRPPGDTVLERHVWLGQDALLLSCERVGMGSIVGARAMLKGRVPPRVAMGGVPARVLRDEVSWGRHPYGMTDEERLAIGRSALPGR